jgi:hypothetical protein
MFPVLSNQPFDRTRRLASSLAGIELVGYSHVEGALGFGRNGPGGAGVR